jgi:Putative zinc-finger
MSCRSVRNSMSAYLDERLRDPERIRVAQHLAQCRDCDAYRREVSGVCSSLKHLGRRPVPRKLQTGLLVIASHERARWNSTRTWQRAWHTGAQHVRLATDNLMRPLALPFAGGLLSALFLFGMLVPTLGFRPSVRNDVPIRLYTEATLVSVPSFGINNDETVVELYIDPKGQATDYSVQRGAITPAMQSELANMMFFSRFTPATWFGRPTNGRVLISFRSVHYVVRG